MSRRCRFCCKDPDADHPRLASGTVPPVDDTQRFGEIFRRYPPKHPTVVRDGKEFAVCRWVCKNIRGHECCDCCRPEGVLLPNELSDAEAKQMAKDIGSGAV